MRCVSSGSLNSCANRSPQIRPPSRRRDEEVAGPGAGRPPAGRGEHVAPHVQHRHQVVAPVRIRHAEHHRFLGEVQPGRRIERVEVRPHHHPKVGARIFPEAMERVRRPPPRQHVGPDIGRLLAGQIHREQRVEIDIGLGGDGRDVIGRRAGLGRCRGRRPQGTGNSPGNEGRCRYGVNLGKLHSEIPMVTVTDSQPQDGAPLPSYMPLTAPRHPNPRHAFRTPSGEHGICRQSGRTPSSAAPG